ncbi:hypothetical protein NP493_477g01008 [Ridgeia piscesae]|uniref:Selenoprotein O n=1 Tax=Ridgeia piscesae TaxID=27915 RepID=A0AAD9KYF1_RIDPI|nr:hypothetical protein NP493_477g01008 [Ridgeia piscesae]
MAHANICKLNHEVCKTGKYVCCKRGFSDAIQPPKCASLQHWQFAPRHQLLLERFPVDKERRNYVREVKKAIFSAVKPTPLKGTVVLAAFSNDALTEVLDMSPAIRFTDEFTAFVSGGQVLQGSTPLSHRYGGHQFGVWADQLGDGRAHMLGDTNVAAIVAAIFSTNVADIVAAIFSTNVADIVAAIFSTNVAAIVAAIFSTNVADIVAAIFSTNVADIVAAIFSGHCAAIFNTNVADIVAAIFNTNVADIVAAIFSTNVADIVAAIFNTNVADIVAAIFNTNVADIVAAIFNTNVADIVAAIFNTNVADIVAAIFNTNVADIVAAIFNTNVADIVAAIFNTNVADIVAAIFNTNVADIVAAIFNTNVADIVAAIFNTNVADIVAAIFNTNVADIVAAIFNTNVADIVAAIFNTNVADIVAAIFNTNVADIVAAIFNTNVADIVAAIFQYKRIPTSRAATLVVSSERVWRDQFYTGHRQAEPTAVVLRLAKSWFRIGSLEILARNDENDLLKSLADFVIEHHFQSISLTDPDRYLAFYSEIVTETAELVARWQAVGFTHGVCNTDNFSLLSITIDYGPFRFMDDYAPHMVPNTSDDEHRYSYERQPGAGRYNLDMLRRALEPSSCPINGNTWTSCCADMTSSTTGNVYSSFGRSWA